MSDWEAEIGIALAQLLGIAAIVGSLLIWRAGEFGPASRRRRRLEAVAANGLLGSEARRERRRLRERWALVCIAVYASTHFFVHVFQYLHRVNWVIQNRIGLDTNHFAQLGAGLRTLLGHTLFIGTATVVVFGLDWFVQLRTDESKASLPAPDWSAAEVIPKDWRLAPEGLWEVRVAEMEQSHPEWPKAAPTWRSEWDGWARTVVAYRSHSAAMMRGMNTDAPDHSSTPPTP